jgi:hypothetical protein
VDAEVSVQTDKPRAHADEPTSVRVRFVCQHAPPPSDARPSAETATDTKPPASREFAAGEPRVDGDVDGYVDDYVDGYVAPSAEAVLAGGDDDLGGAPAVAKQTLSVAEAAPPPAVLPPEAPAALGSPSRKTLFVVRHGESKWNDAQVLLSLHCRFFFSSLARSHPRLFGIYER